MVLLGFSIVTVYNTDVTTFHSTGTSYQFIKHLTWILVSVASMIIMTTIDYHHLQKLSIPILIVSTILLLLVLIPGIGTVTNGARRWIRFNQSFGLQPSEFAKLAIIIFLSSYISKNYSRMSELKRGFIIPLAITAGVCALILKEPDLGTSSFIAILSVILLITGGTRIAFVFLPAIVSVPLFYKIVLAVPYRKDRIMAFLDPWKDPSGTGYHIIQSLIAFGSGGLTGLGIGESKQKLLFLPECSTDFIFTIIGEELGFIGVIGIIALFALLIWQGLKVSHKAKDLFGFLLGTGITLMFGLQALINIAVVAGKAPTKGMPLPFVSAGGSSLLFSMIGIGILISIARQSEKSEAADLNTDNVNYIDDSRSSLFPARFFSKITAKIASFCW
jgi:cell division protein FtsW